MSNIVTPYTPRKLDFSIILTVFLIIHFFIYMLKSSKSHNSFAVDISRCQYILFLMLKNCKNGQLKI